jgi:hypothetical protein
MQEHGGIDGDDHPKKRQPHQKKRQPQGQQRPTSSDGSCPLRNYKHELFAQEIAKLSEQAALGTDGEDAYVLAGFARHRRNHIRLMRWGIVAKRIEWLQLEREATAQAARMALGTVIDELRARGIERFDDLIERNSAGIVSVRDYSSLPVEIGIAALKIVHRAFGIKTPIGG